MSRSLRKGPFVAYHLLTKINKMNDTDKKTTIKILLSEGISIDADSGHKKCFLNF